MTTATDAPPVEIKEFLERDARTNTLERFTAVTGLPGLPAGRRMILVKPVNGQPKDLMFAVEINGGTVLKAWSTEKHFVGSPVWPEGIDLGVVRFFTDIGMGQPYPERSELQVGEEGYLLLRAYANGEKYHTMSERRRLYLQSERKTSEKSMIQTPAAAAASPIDIDALVSKRVNEERAKIKAEILAELAADKD
jgi:hypothetical protein